MGPSFKVVLLNSVFVGPMNSARDSQKNAKRKGKSVFSAIQTCTDPTTLFTHLKTIFSNKLLIFSNKQYLNRLSHEAVKSACEVKGKRKAKKNKNMKI